MVTYQVPIWCFCTFFHIDAAIVFQQKVSHYTKIYPLGLSQPVISWGVFFSNVRQSIIVKSDRRAELMM